MFQVITGVDAPEMYTISFRLSEVFQAVSDSMIVNVRWACTELGKLDNYKGNIQTAGDHSIN